MAPKTSDFRKVVEDLQATAGGRRRGRSDLYLWMFARADQIEKLIAEYELTWEMIAEAISRLGIRDGFGNLPTADRCRKTRFAVRQAKGWTARRGRTAAAAPMSNAKPADGQPTQQPPLVDDEDDVLLRAGDGTIFAMKRPTDEAS